jgi:flagellar assembly protein FliH
VTDPADEPVIDHLEVHTVFLNYATEQIVNEIKTALNLEELPEELVSAIDSRVDDAISEAYDEGHEEGNSEGYDSGYEAACDEFDIAV